MTSVSPGQPGYAGHNNPHEPETHISKIRYAKAGKDYDPMVLLSQRTLELPPQNYNLRQYTAPPPWQLAGTGGYKARRRLGPRLCVHAAQAHRRCLPCARLGRPQGPKREIPASRQTEANAGEYDVIPAFKRKGMPEIPGYPRWPEGKMTPGTTCTGTLVQVHGLHHCEDTVIFLVALS